VQRSGSLRQLLGRGDPGLVNQHILAVAHGRDGNLGAVCGNGGADDDVHLRVRQQVLRPRKSFELRKAAGQALGHPWVGALVAVTDALRTCGEQALNEVINVAVVNTDHRKPDR
jgi:hypothetical protein